MPFQPTHTIRFTFPSGLYGEVDVELRGTEGPAYRADGSSRWSLQGGRWLIDGGTTLDGQELQIEARPYGSRPGGLELTGTIQEKLEQLAAIERARQQARVQSPQAPTGPLDAELLQRVSGRWRCHQNAWPPVIDLELAVIDAGAGTLSHKVRAMGSEASCTIQVLSTAGSTLRVQRTDTFEVSSWTLADDKLVCGERPLETVLVFERQMD